MDAGNVVDERVRAALQGESPASARSTGEELRNNFMTLLVTQLRNQDPLNPLKNSELTSHLAQINTVSGIDALNETLEGITSQIATGQSLQAAALIGKGVLVPGERVLVGEGGAATPFGVELERPAAELRLRVMGADGQVLREFSRQGVPAGVQTFGWDGLTAAGETAPPGAYRLTLEALDENGETLPGRLLNYALINGVSTGQDGVRLDLGAVAGQVRLEDVRSIL